MKGYLAILFILIVFGILIFFIAYSLFQGGTIWGGYVAMEDTFGQLIEGFLNFTLPPLDTP